MAAVRRLRPLLVVVGSIPGLLAGPASGCAASPTDAHVAAKPAPTPAGPLAEKPGPPEDLTPPLGRLPTDVRPLRYGLELNLDPKLDRFGGKVDILLSVDRARRVFFLHGKDLRVTRATFTALDPTSKTPDAGPIGAPIDAAYEQVTTSGVARLTANAPVAGGLVRLHLEWDAPYDRHLRGLYRVDRGGESYAFTQFEAVSARQAFPCFDEPVFKTRYDVTLVVPDGLAAIANTSERTRDKGRVTFATTEPLPTYLLAWAVGPLDVVDAKPIAPNTVRKTPLPFRAIAAKGRGKELAYTLAHTGELVSTLEGWFGIPYPYDKLDVLAVPDRDGAMENAGAITFHESLLLVDEKLASLQQKRAFAGVMAHELAHHWFGDLVTMPWWDDLWLNEAFASWMGSRAVQLWQPETNADVYLLDRVHDAMSVDSWANARAIRQPIAEDHDIANAFDAITYSKGAGVLSMFERWLGRDRFRLGIRKHLSDHAHGTAVADELLLALSEAASTAEAKTSLFSAFHSFLDQPGVPFLAAHLECSPTPRLVVEQSRYLPLGSKGNADARWGVPICARYPEGDSLGEACMLLEAKTGELPLGGKTCPAWVMPNANAAGYFRFGLPKAQLDALLQKGWPALATRERMAVVDSIRAGFARGTLKADEVLEALAPRARDEFPSIAAAPMSVVASAREWLEPPLRARVEAWARKLYAAQGVSFAAAKGETPERTILRQSVLGFLTSTAQDPTLRKEAAALGRAYVGFGKDFALHPEAVDPNLAGLALALAAETGDAAFFDALLALLVKTEDSAIRARILSALGAVKGPSLAARAQALTLDPRLRVNEVMIPLGAQLAAFETRPAAWEWLRAHFEQVVTRLSPARAGGLPYYLRFCDAPHVAEVAAFFSPKIAALDGGPRNLASALEAMQLCVARRSAHEAGLRAFFAKAK